MKKNKNSNEISLIEKSAKLDNPVLRYLVKKYNLSRVDMVVLGVLLELTDQRKTDIRTHYHVIAKHAGISDMKAYQSVNSLHRHWIIDSKPVGNFVHISFNEIIEEIDLAQRNAKKIQKLEAEISNFKDKKYINSDDFVDIITPLVGRIITAKMAEALSALVNYINDKIHSATSFKLWRYRFQSIRTGLPVAEIIFRNSLPYLVEEILLIEKKSSVLISNAFWKENPGADKDVVAAMLSAITEFIKTSFNKEDSSLNEIRFGDSKIQIFECRYFYAAVLIYGNPSSEFFNSLDSILNDVHVKFREKLRTFTGDMHGLKPIGQILSDFINKTNAQTERIEEVKSFIKFKIFAAVCTAVIIAGVVFFTLGQVKDCKLENKILAALNASLPPFSHDIEIDVDDKTLTITGTVSSPDTGAAIAEIVSGFPEIKKIANRTVSADFRTVEKYKNNMSKFEKKFKVLELLFVKQELEKIVIQFPTGVSALGENQVLQARKIFEILKYHPDIEVEIIAFNDPPGGIKLNRELAGERMKAIKDYLTAHGIDGEKIHVTEFNPDVIDADPRYKDYKDSRGIMLFARKNLGSNF